MTSEDIPAPVQPSRVPYVDFKYSRLYFGIKFWIAVALIIASVATTIAADPVYPAGRAALAAVAITGVIIGLLLQPVPKAIDHSGNARQALQNLSTGHEYLSDVRTVIAQVDGTSDKLRLQIALAGMDIDLERTQTQIESSMTEWDAVAPGAVETFVKNKQRGREILRQLRKGSNE